VLVKTQGEVLEYQVLWMRHFLATQWQYILTTTIYQDNKSTILLAKNGRTSSSKLACHLNARYFFVTDKLKKDRSSSALWTICWQISFSSHYRINEGKET